MFKGNNRSIVKLAARGSSQSEFCAVCGFAIVDIRGGVCHSCAAKAEKRMQCGKKHNILTRIIHGMPACVLKGGEVLHEGKGCGGCRFEEAV